MGKRKKSSRKPTGPKKREPLGVYVWKMEYKIITDLLLPAATTFTCLFCNHHDSVIIRVDRKEGVGYLMCKVCDQRYQSKVNRTSFLSFILQPLLTHFVAVDLTEPVDIYSEWIDAADAAQKETTPLRPATSSKTAPRAAAPASDDE